LKKTSLAVLFGFGALSADTLTLRDGTRIDGTLLRATERTITFVDSRGDRRDYNLANIEELAFGETDSSRSRTEPGLDSTGSVDLIYRLNEDIGTALDRSTLSDKQKELLEAARMVLNTAAEDLRDNRKPNAREVRRALDNARYVMNGSGVRAQDRRAVLDDIQQLRNQHSELNSKSR
jgi:acyl carrier protein